MGALVIDIKSGDNELQAGEHQQYAFSLLDLKPQLKFWGLGLLNLSRMKLRTFPAMALVLTARLPVVRRRFFGEAFGVAAADDDADPGFLAAAA